MITSRGKLLGRTEKIMLQEWSTPSFSRNVTKIEQTTSQGFPTRLDVRRRGYCPFLLQRSSEEKYHICLIKPSIEQAGLFLFLNSKNPFNDSLAIDCGRIPELRPTQSGQSYICCAQVCYSELILQEHVPKKIVKWILSCVKSYSGLLMQHTSLSVGLNLNLLER